MFSGPMWFDLAISHAVQSWSSPAIVWLMKAISWIAEPAIQAGVALLIVLWLWRRGRHHTAAFIGWLAAGIIWILPLKIWFDRPRPSGALVHVLATEATRSFPSGHAFVATLLAGGLIVWAFAGHWRSRWWWLVGGIVYIKLVGLARIGLGVHWATDILGGVAFAALWITLVELGLRRWRV